MNEINEKLDELAEKLLTIEYSLLQLSESLRSVSVSEPTTLRLQDFSDTMSSTKNVISNMLSTVEMQQKSLANIQQLEFEKIVDTLNKYLERLCAATEKQTTIVDSLLRQNSDLKSQFSKEVHSHITPILRNLIVEVRCEILRENKFLIKTLFSDFTEKSSSLPAGAGGGTQPQGATHFRLLLLVVLANFALTLWTVLK